MQTYSESRRKVYFLAARSMRCVAVRVLEDVTTGDPACFTTFEGLRWTKHLAAKTAHEADALENLGYEIGTHLDSRSETEQHKSRVKYSDAVTRFQAKIKAHAGDDMLARVNDYDPFAS